MYYWETCGSGGHVLHENVLWEDMSSRWACLTGGHVLWEVMYYGETCLTRGYVLKEDISYIKTYLEVRNVIHDSGRSRRFNRSPTRPPFLQL